MNSVTIEAGSGWATVQDLGRQGWQHLGLAPGGAMDPVAHRLAQRLVGNPVTAAGIEFSVGSLTLSVADPVAVAVTGASSVAHCRGQRLAMNSAVILQPGDALHLGPPADGMYSYVALAGGIATPPVFGSRSTVVREGLGGYRGRTLAPGDSLPLGESDGAALYRYPHLRAAPPALLTLRFLPCFQYSAFPEAVQRGFETRVFRVSGRSDRMGCRLAGDSIDAPSQALYSEGTCLGAIQIPPDGQPIVLLRDRQTLGGYPKLGAVIAADCVRIAQARPGQRVRFRAVLEGEARRVRWLTANYESEQTLLPADQG